jgi:uncharacterized protein (TIGR02466 family)
MIRDIFPTPLMVGDIPNFEEVVNELKEKKEGIQQYLKSDEWGDNVVSSNNSTPCILSALNLTLTKKTAIEIFKEYSTGTYYKKWNLKLKQSWFNVIGPGGFQDMHTHDFSDVVGCFYIDVPKNSGNIQLAPLVELAENKDRETIEPYPGMYIFFPGYIMHRVTYNKSSAQRVSLAFNFGKYDLV